MYQVAGQHGTGSAESCSAVCRSSASGLPSFIDGSDERSNSVQRRGSHVGHRQVLIPEASLDSKSNVKRSLCQRDECPDALCSKSL
jgi:hypothetical protein